MSKTRTSHRPSNNVGLVAAAVAGVAVLVVGGLLLARGSDDSPSGNAADRADPGVAHVHGLGVNPADGALYVATHHGTFRITDGGQAERLGDSFQDTMGFTIVGPDDFLGSGHPDVAGLQEGQPALLGLIESADRGVSWEPVSLSGEVDFHGLAAAHGQVYGWDSTSGRFMVSTDRRDWETRSTVDLYGFAVDPTNPDHIIGAGSEGLVASNDGGRTWDSVDGPRLVALTWTESGIWGADPDGGVHHSSDGATWQRQGELPGPPQALAAKGTTTYAAAQDGDATGIYRSDDQGRTWDLLYRDSNQ